MYSMVYTVQAIPAVSQCAVLGIIIIYSETSDKGHSERGQTSQQRTSHKRLCIHTL